MADYTYRFADLLSDADVAELELSGVRFDRRIIVPGSFSGSMVVPNPEIAARVRAVVPGKTVVHVYRDSEIWGTYIIWSVRVRSNGATTSVEFSGASLESWFYRRIIDYDKMEYTDTDQIDILREMVNGAQVGWFPYEANANLGITVYPDTGGSGVNRDRTYLKTEAASYGQRMEELANVDDGFEYMIRTYTNDAGGRTRELVWGYPTLNFNAQNFAYFYPGNIKSYEFNYDANETATAYWARGDTIESDYVQNAEPLMTQYPALAEDYLASGFPHLDKVLDYSSVTEITTLEAYAAYWAYRSPGLVMIPVIETVPENFPFNPNFLGSTATFTITDSFFPLDATGKPSYSGTYRIVGVEVTPPDRGSSEVIKFVIEDDFDPTDTGA